MRGAGQVERELAGDGVAEVVAGLDEVKADDGGRDGGAGSEPSLRAPRENGPDSTPGTSPIASAPVLEDRCSRTRA
jgi:hypothetical protein